MNNEVHQPTFQNLQIDDHLPDIEDIDFKSIHPSYRTIMLFGSSLFFIVVTSAGIIAQQLGLVIIPAFVSAIVWSAWLLFILANTLFTLKNFTTRKYAVREKDITFQSGWVFHNITTVPFTRVQHIELEEGPMERFFKLASLQIYTAGDSGSDLTIKGLEKEEAKKIKAFITQEVNHD
ncbi:MAG: membrane protein YdbS with pleckstrin-like domain [Bacteroidia bacterium]|jgi:membrane protein YdbS with pleckstrin-like domain